MTEEVKPIRTRKPKTGEGKLEATPAKSTKGVHLTPRQWAEADALWESGEVTLKMLATRFGKDYSTFKNSFDRRGIVKGSAKDRMQAEIKQQIEKEAVGDATILAARIKETKEEVYKMSSGIRKLMWADMLKAKNDNVPFGAILNNLKALDAAISVLKKTQETSYTVLGLDDDNYVDEDALPELVISELTAEQVEMLRGRDTLTTSDVAVEDDPNEFDVVEEQHEQ